MDRHRSLFVWARVVLLVSGCTSLADGLSRGPNEPVDVTVANDLSEPASGVLRIIDGEGDERYRFEFAVEPGGRTAGPPADLGYGDYGLAFTSTAGSIDPAAQVNADSSLGAIWVYLEPTGPMYAPILV